MRIDLKTAIELTSEEVQDVFLMFRDIGDDPLRVQESFRGMFPKKIAEAMGELRALRRRAAQKFQMGRDMYCTKPLLEQASSEPVANHRAQRFAEAGLTVVHDPCCGMGSDSIALARAGLKVKASDKNDVAVEFARANAEIYRVSSSIEFTAADITTDPPGKGAIFLDPARRRGARRIMNPEDWSPNPETVSRLIQGRGAACVKLSPATDLERLFELFPMPDEIEFISYRGEAKECVFWYGKVASKNERRATMLPDGAFYAGQADPQAPVGELSNWIFDPDPALVRAGLLGAFAKEHGLCVLDPAIGYLTGPKDIDSPFLRGFRVIAQETLDPKKMRVMLREHKVGRLLVRKRGIAERPQTLEARFLPKKFGDRQLTLLAMRLGERHIGVLAEED
ncbi:MAG: hypothetical protein HOM34_02180 [Planctomycetes bacterium]|jgi:hypothetical protein|nr:hypothetical protein [Planctomycetota bacterium]MBT4027999.1 hypothetical protein [Planctomycetota bacterium]MBT4561111.1 hypothetical protein [Planctomycetota bacterium]MBT5102230.1 hypothetical protein [Planctomycetota bacterium]MBT5119511.1 hypothetical protein [Planctomycetota bacterium]